MASSDSCSGCETRQGKEQQVSTHSLWNGCVMRILAHHTYMVVHEFTSQKKMHAREQVVCAGVELQQSKR